MASVSNTTTNSAEALYQTLNGNSQKTETKKSAGEEMQDRFLTLLMAQIRSQDPLNPMENAEFTSRLSIGNILSQSTGLPRNAYDRDIERNASYQTVRGKLATSPLSCGPGECYSYQNVAFSVFGDVV